MTGGSGTQSAPGARSADTSAQTSGEATSGGGGFSTSFPQFSALAL